MRFFRFLCAILFFLFTAIHIEAADTKPELVLQTGHTGSILALAISPDGRWLVSGGQDSTLKIWDLKSGTLLRTLYGHNAKISSVAVSPDNRYIASSADGGTARLWDVYGGHGMRDLGGHAKLISSVAFASGGNQVLTASTDVIKIWETSTGKELRSVRIPEKDQGGRCTLSADGRIYTIGGAVQAPKTGYFSAFTGGCDIYRPLKVIEIANGRELMSLKTNIHTPFATYVISPDSRFLAMRGSQRKKDANEDFVRIYDVSSGKEIATLGIPGNGTAHAIGALAFSSGGKWLAAEGELGASLSTSVVLFDVSTKQQVRKLNSSGMFTPAVNLEVMKSVVNPFAFSPDAKILAFGGSTSIQLWDADSGQPLRSLRTHVKAGMTSDSAVDQEFVQAMQDSGIEEEDANLMSDTGGIMETLSDPESPLSGFMGSANKIAGLQGLELPTRSIFEKRIHFSPDGRWLLSENQHVIKIWDIAAGSFQQQRFWIGVPVAFSPDGKFFASMTFDSQKAKKMTSLQDMTQDLVVRDLDTWTVLSKTSYTGSMPQELAFGPDGSWLAITIKKEIRIMEVKTGKILRSFVIADGAPIEAALFDTSGRYFATGGKAVSEAPSIFAMPGLPGGMQMPTGKMDKKQMKELQKQMEKMQKDMMKSLSGQTSTPQDSPYEIKIYDLQSGKQIQTIATEKRQAPEGEIHVEGFGKDERHRMIFSKDGALMAIEDTDQMFPSVKIFETATGQRISTIRVSNKPIQNNSSDPMSMVFTQKMAHPVFAFSPDHSTIAISSQESGYTVNFYESKTGRFLRTLPHNNRIDAVAFSVDGRFLISVIRDGSRSIWDLSSGTLRATLMEFPGLHYTTEWLVATPDGLFDGSPGAWNQILWRFSQNTFDLAPVETFFNEFYYPGLLAEIFAAKPPQAPRDLSQLDRRQPLVKLNSNSKGESRNAIVQVEVNEAAADSQNPKGSGARDVRLFRNGSLVKVWRGDVLQGASGKVLEATVPLVAGENRLVAYAFNQDNVKSTDAHLDIKGAENLKRKGIAYIVAIGINEYANPDFNLKFAVADAQAFSENLKQSQTRLEEFERVEVISLFDREATKSNILSALKAFGEGDRRAEPEDALILYYAGHGTAEKEHFYMVPHDLGYTGSRNQMSDAAFQSIIQQAISDEELEQILETVGAGQTLLVIDACNSGQALESQEKRRGPMNAKGLAQLAYEKGMYILAAAQGYQAALEAARLGHGYLTYALIEEGIKTSSADNSPQDGRILAQEWLSYAAQRVPEMQSEKMQEARLLKHEIAFVDGEENIQNLRLRTVQQPRLFYRRGMEYDPFLILKQ